LSEFKLQHASIIESFEKIIEQTFDEYEGLRQIKDFRGLGGPVGNYILKEGNRICGFFKKMFVVTIVMIVFKIEESPDNRSKLPRFLEYFTATKRKLLVQYYNLKTGLLRETQTLSSLRNKDYYSLNCVIAKQFVQEITTYSEEVMKKITQKYESQMQLINKLPIEVRNKVFEKIGGNYKGEIEKCFVEVQPWVNEWAKPQALSIIQREVFAKSYPELEALLKQSKDVMIQGFKALVDNNMAQPLSELTKLLTLLQKEIELVSFVLI